MTTLVQFANFLKIVDKLVAIMESTVGWIQGRRKYLKLGGARHFEGTFSIRKRGHFLGMKRALLCLLQNLGGKCPQCPPVPTSMAG